uniref:AAA_9 domain-containing protein n=1 Tax=Echinostoma caproni TaxID=27848 RepID=A0A183AUF9_9TREM
LPPVLLHSALARIEKQLQQKEEIIGHVKEENARLEAALKRLHEEVRCGVRVSTALYDLQTLDVLLDTKHYYCANLDRFRLALLDLRRRAVFIPGAYFINRIICDVLRMCPVTFVP